MSAVAPGALTASSLAPDAVELGRLHGPWGLKGWLHVQPYAQNTQTLLTCSDWFLQPPAQSTGLGFSAFSGCVLVQAAEVKPHGNDGLVARIAGIETRDAAQALKGARIFVPRSAFPVPDTDEYYWVDLIELTVVNRQEIPLGVVSELLSTGPHAVLVVQYTDEAQKTAERLIPFVSAYIDNVDQTTRRITVDWQPDY